MSSKCFYQNVRGFRTKVASFCNAVSVSDYNVITLTETWLLDDISSSELFSIFLFSDLIEALSRLGFREVMVLAEVFI